MVSLALDNHWRQAQHRFQTQNSPPSRHRRLCSHDNHAELRIFTDAAAVEVRLTANRRARTLPIGALEA
jgi:hypothetical protein